MRVYLHILLIGMSVFLSACNDDNDSDKNNTPKPSESACKMHCAP